MSASIYTLLADELDISDKKAKKLLSAMLREVQKRARKQDDGVRLPNFGRFTVDDGELTFSPSDGLARAVNQRFEGLEGEDLANAPGEVDREPEQQDDGPSTITLGYQAGNNFDPIDEGEEEAATAQADGDTPDTAEFQAPDTGTDSAPDTAEFQAPDSDSGPAPDTAEFQAPDSPEPDSTPEPNSPADAAPTTDPDPAPEPDEPNASDSNSNGAPKTTEYNPGVPPSSSPPTADPDASSSDEEPSSSDPSAPDDAASSPDTPDSPPQKTEELYPLVEDVPGSSSDEKTEAATSPDASTSEEQSASESKEEHDELSGIWDEVEKETREMPAMSDDADADPTASADDSASSSTDFPPEEFSSEEPSSEEPSSEEPSSEEPAESVSEDVPSEESETDTDSESDTAADTTSSFDPDPAPSSPPSPPATDNSSVSGLRIAAAVFVFALLGSGAWYILGQRGMIPGPGATVSTLKAQIEADFQQAQSAKNAQSSGPPDASALEGGFPNASSPTTEETETASPESDQSSDADTEDPTRADASPSESAPSPSSDEPSPDPTTADPADASSRDAPSRAITPANGGWSIIVASRSDRDGAASLVTTYRDRFTDEQLPVDLLQATVNNATRYRVGIGQFSTRSEAQRFLDEHKSDLPDGAWPLRLQ